MKVHEIMTGHPRSVSPNTSLVEAAGLMREFDVGALPVCDDGTLAGIVTDRDIVIRGVADSGDPATTAVSEVMSGGVEAVSADDEVEDAVRIMEQRQIRRLPVLDRSKRLVGMVSLGDVATSSNPAFGGIALRDVSEPNLPTARRRKLAQRSEPTRIPAISAGRSKPSRKIRTRSDRNAGRSRNQSVRRKGTKRRRSAARGKSAGR
jgi:CBS domain-containing protein